MKDAALKKDFTKNLIQQLSTLQNETGILAVAERAIIKNDKAMLDLLLSPSKQFVEDWLRSAAKLAKTQRQTFLSQPWTFWVKKEFFTLIEDKIAAERQARNSGQGEDLGIILRPAAEEVTSLITAGKLNQQIFNTLLDISKRKVIAGMRQQFETMLKGVMIDTEPAPILLKTPSGSQFLARINSARLLWAKDIEKIEKQCSQVSIAKTTDVIDILNEVENSDLNEHEVNEPPTVDLQRKLAKIQIIMRHRPLVAELDINIPGLRYFPMPPEPGYIRNAIEYGLQIEPGSLRKKMIKYYGLHLSALEGEASKVISTGAKGVNDASFEKYWAAHAKRCDDCIKIPNNLSLGHFVKLLMQGSTWNDDAEILLAMQVLKRPIIIVQAHGITNEKSLKLYSGEPLFVYMDGHDHLGALVRTRELSASHILQLAMQKGQNKSIKAHHPQPAPQPMVDTHHYSDDEINKLFHHYFAANAQVACLTPMLGTQWQGMNILVDNLVEYKKVRSSKIDAQQPVEHTVLVPVNLNQNHWVLLWLVYLPNAKEPSSAHYFDPLGTAIPAALTQELAQRFLPSAVTIDDLQQRIQNNSYDCGPFVVEAARSLLLNNSVTNANLNMTLARQEHKKILGGSTQNIIPAMQQPITKVNDSLEEININDYLDLPYFANLPNKTLRKDILQKILTEFIHVDAIYNNESLLEIAIQHSHSTIAVDLLLRNANEFGMKAGADILLNTKTAEGVDLVTHLLTHESDIDKIIDIFLLYANAREKISPPPEPKPDLAGDSGIYYNRPLSYIRGTEGNTFNHRLISTISQEFDVLLQKKGESFKRRNTLQKKDFALEQSIKTSRLKILKCYMALNAWILIDEDMKQKNQRGQEPLAHLSEVWQKLLLQPDEGSLICMHQSIRQIYLRKLSYACQTLYFDNNPVFESISNKLISVNKSKPIQVGLFYPATKDKSKREYQTLDTPLQLYTYESLKHMRHIRSTVKNGEKAGFFARTTASLFRSSIYLADATAYDDFLDKLQELEYLLMESVYFRDHTNFYKNLQHFLANDKQWQDYQLSPWQKEAIVGTFSKENDNALKIPGYACKLYRGEHTQILETASADSIEASTETTNDPSLSISQSNANTFFSAETTDVSKTTMSKIDQTALGDMLKKNILKHHPLQGGGHCFYEAMEYLLNVKENIIRANMAKYITENLADLIKNNVISENIKINSYIKGIETGTKQSFDNAELICLMQMLDRIILVMTSEGKLKNLDDIKQLPPKYNQPLFLLYNLKLNRYEPLYCYNNICPNDVYVELSTKSVAVDSNPDVTPVRPPQSP